MITSKRRTLTTDDLLRRQEEPRKRRKQSPVVRTVEAEDSSPGEDDDFDLTSEDAEVEEDASEWESEVEESPDSETHEETSLVESGRLGHSSESSGLLGSRVTVKPRQVHRHRHTLSPEAGPSKQVTFSSLGISPPLLSALSKMAIHTPTEIQRACIPPLLAGLLVVARVLDPR
jgi:ATP-dependent RNA helicase DDX49/DBP8